MAHKTPFNSFLEPKLGLNHSFSNSSLISFGVGSLPIPKDISRELRSSSDSVMEKRGGEGGEVRR